jgi:hypothetical protein
LSLGPVYGAEKDGNYCAHPEETYSALAHVVTPVAFHRVMNSIEENDRVQRSVKEFGFTMQVVRLHNRANQHRKLCTRKAQFLVVTAGSAVSPGRHFVHSTTECQAKANAPPRTRTVETAAYWTV